MTLSPKSILQPSEPSSYGFRQSCQAVRDCVPIQEVARRYTNLEPFGGRASFTGRCPLRDHEDRTPSFYIYPPGRFHCYGCGGTGDVVDLEFHCGGYNELWEAMISLAVEYGVQLPGRSKGWHKAQERRVTYLTWAYEVIGEELSRRVFRVTVLPFIDAITDPGEREEALLRAWERWQRKSWKTIAEAVCQGDESMIVALARIYAETQEALT
jgi:DNA primase